MTYDEFIKRSFYCQDEKRFNGTENFRVYKEERFVSFKEGKPSTKGVKNGKREKGKAIDF